MFSGIIAALGEVVELQERPPGVRLVVRAGEVAAAARIGDSVAVSGCCLTVVERDGERLAFDAGQETLSRTSLARLRIGGAVNLESSLRIGEPLGGHFVTGHVDAVGTLDERIDAGDWSTCWFRVPPQLMRQMASKGSVAVDGVSLTLVDVDVERFSVALIPHTLAVTTLGRLRAGDAVNIETDVLAKYVERALAAMRDEEMRRG
jgi:riboflavin synthase